MLGRVQRNASLFYVAFDREASLIKDDLLEPIDALLDDPTLVEQVERVLGRQHPRSRTMGRERIAADRLLRCVVLKHIKQWSFRELERELRSSLVYRRFTRFDQQKIPRYVTFSRNFAVLGDDVVHAIHLRVVATARQERIAPGRKLRTDTTVVETNVHHPTDSSLLADGLRVITRALGRISEECTDGALKVVNHARAAKHRVLEINRAAKSFTEASRERLKGSYAKLVALTQRVLRHADKVSSDLREGRLPLVGKPVRVMMQQTQLAHFVPLVKKVVAQTKARVFGGDTHVVDKVLSLFEEHTRAIRKGKAHKPTEFGRLVRIDEIEHGIVSNYDVKDGNPADQQDWMPALSQHKEIFGRAPKMATADRGFHSAKNVQEAHGLGVEKVALPSRGRLSGARAKIQKQRWFQRALRWRAGIEGRIATLKHRFGLVRARYKSDRGFKRYVGWSIITHNLVSIARARAQRKVKNDASPNARAP